VLIDPYIAARVMYQRARKLAELSSLPSEMVELAEMQREAYVVALNALALLDEKNAWFVVQLNPGPASDGVRTLQPFDVGMLTWGVIGEKAKETMQVHPG
jgi:hypothetical protein